MVGTLLRWHGIRGLAARTLGVLAIFGLFLWSGKPANAAYSSIVIEAATGRVIMAHDPELQNYPASLTKMMTLFLTFKELEQGKLTLDTVFTVSAHAAAQVPSKLGLRPGEKVPLRDLVFGIVTHSANDAAVTIAENIAGSEPGFAKMMNAEARRLGMNHTNFANASGLPNPRNVSTVADLAKLARALYLRFPKEYRWFSTEEFKFAGETFYNHNHLMNHYPGMDGIKTGYIHASGFNLAASAVRGGRRLIGVIMGGESAHSRDMQMASLLNAAFAETGVEVADDPNAAPKGDTITRQAGRAIAALSPVAHAEAATTAHPRHRAPVFQEDWTVQVGAYGQRAAAEHAAIQALALIHRSATGRSRLVTVPLRGRRGRLYEARIVHFTEHDAYAACNMLRRRHHSCLVMAPHVTRVATR